jgi:RimJ/RimL family protein N-acetyltransferase
MTLKLIDPKIWGRDFVRGSQKLIRNFMDEFRLKRISIETADRRIVRMAEMAGFKYEGERPNDLRWDGKYYDKYFLGLYEERDPCEKFQ